MSQVGPSVSTEIQPNQTDLSEKPWIALSIGNSLLHWAWFVRETLQEAWETPHQRMTTINLRHIPDWHLPPGLLANWGHGSDPWFELWVVSVVPEQTTRWQSYPGARVITLDQIPLQATYPTLGVDRALAVWQAGAAWGWPILVIDAGTALTLTGADATGRFVGGAILPGLGLQVRSLAQSTAALSWVELPDHLPNRWAANTLEAIQSGTVYTVLAGVQDFVQTWLQEFPQSQIVLTGGDCVTLLNYLKAWFAQLPQAPEWMPQLVSNPHLILLGIQSLRRRLKSTRQ